MAYRQAQPSYPERPVYTSALREGPYAHLSVAGVQHVILQVAEPKSLHFSNVSSPISEYSWSGKSSYEKENPWVPFKVALDEDNDPEAMLESLQVIFERRLTMANRIPEHDWVIEEAKLAYALTSKKNVKSHIEGSTDQFRYLPMAPTRMNKELVRIRRSQP